MDSASGLAHTFRLYNSLPALSTHEFKSYNLVLQEYFCASIKVRTKEFCLLLCGKNDNLFGYHRIMIL